ncbi:type II secretion system protein N [Pseudomonas cannabina]|uniref:Type II secretion system protein GspC N-terminal domain-containing protein n=1 Tax=Pseudomonas cannabina TaxID=86840 RepID=A0A0P9L942_PSECA|nr:type II secretion system protein N [Pseudomonas cannabina]KAA8716021.1 general secretion pathway protein GspC [Pseudomonas cannabina]KPW73375.1 Uncharacterized protein ALO81_02921 [Pseudomonas cannabina]RMN23752.1 hypothetical protein ALQ64_01522 [Pseudomonas cannabina]SDQ81958.1 type II secretion system protein C (GspC) [Pseudomonas cannabina]
MVVPFAFSAPRLLLVAGLMVALVGVAFWAPRLLAPLPSSGSAPVGQAPASASPARHWFADQPSPVQIKVSGLMAGARGAVAIISLNDGPAGSFLVGEHLARDVRLVAIEADGVVIEQGSEQKRFNVSPLAEGPELPSLMRR